MKYIFCIHSNICYYMSLSVIKYLGLKTDDIVFFYTRNYRPYRMPEYSYADISDIAYACTNLSFFKILHIPMKIRQMDRVIATMTGNDGFSCFVPQMASLPLQIIATNKNCVRYDFIEEGTLYYMQDKYHISYHRSLIMRTAFKLSNMFCKRIKLGHPSLCPLKRSESPFYYILRSPYSICTKNAISLDINFDEILVYDNTYKNDRPILIMDSILENQLAEYKNVLQCYEYIINKLPHKNGLYVKLHPKNDSRTLNLLEEIRSRNNIEMQFITLPIEQILLFNKNKSPLYIGAIHSSLLLYAKVISTDNIVVAGCKVLKSHDCRYDSFYIDSQLNTIFNKIIE